MVYMVYRYSGNTCRHFLEGGGGAVSCKFASQSGICNCQVGTFTVLVSLVYIFQNFMYERLFYVF